MLCCTDMVALLICLRCVSKVLMADGSVRAVQHVRNGDRLLGDDGSVRVVSGVTRGFGPLYGG